ncbi:hypothetical protein V6N12_011645 [Hibiscus sabdariffa]|uniref:Uncharacterized protein n=1 Tax=Hibiscus sabdariffa TaxID=183260 RepID=A0ABR1ZEA8_9ROSI
MLWFEEVPPKLLPWFKRIVDARNLRDFLVVSLLTVYYSGLFSHYTLFLGDPEFTSPDAYPRKNGTLP